MTPEQFVAKWSRADLTERASYQQHFLDLCELVDHKKPADVDPTGKLFCFEKGASKSAGGEGFADVWKRDGFAFEYKGRHKDLDAAYQQLLQYREALGNPPLLVVCDTDRIVIHTNFTATVKRIHEISLANIGTPASLELLRHLFHDPGKRAQIGAHYTSRADIELLVEPVVMHPLRSDWGETRSVIDRLLDTGRKTPPPRGKATAPPTGPALRNALEEARHIKGQYLERLRQVTVLDPACGSGNFLNVTLQKLPELEKDVVLYGGHRGVATDYLPWVRPKQVHGIEINRYAHELASVAVWIGYLQWTRHNGFPLLDRPPLKEMPTFEDILERVLALNLERANLEDPAGAVAEGAAPQTEET